MFSKILKNKVKLILWTLLIFIIILLILGGLFLKQWSKPQTFNILPEFRPLGLSQDISKDIREEKVYSIPKEQSNFNDLYFFVSPDGQKVAYAVAKDTGWAVIINGQTGETYDSLGSVIFSPDSNHFAYTATKNGKEMIVLDNQPGPAFDFTFEPKIFTADSRFFIYKARQEGKDLIMINNWSSKLYDQIYKVTLDPTGNQLFIFARQGQDLYRLSLGLDKSKELK